MEIVPKLVNIPEHSLQNRPNPQICQRKKCLEAIQLNRCKELQSEIFSMPKFHFQDQMLDMITVH